MFHILWNFVVNIEENEGTNFFRGFPPFSLIVNVKLCVLRHDVVNTENVHYMFSQVKYFL
jgi:hypothetical protein